jgi:hypothetical protein
VAPVVRRRSLLGRNSQALQDRSYPCWLGSPDLEIGLAAGDGVKDQRRANSSVTPEKQQIDSAIGAAYRVLPENTMASSRAGRSPCLPGQPARTQHTQGLRLPAGVTVIAPSLQRMWPSTTRVAPDARARDSAPPLDARESMLGPRARSAGCFRARRSLPSPERSSPAGGQQSTSRRSARRARQRCEGCWLATG